MSDSMSPAQRVYLMRERQRARRARGEETTFTEAEAVVNRDARYRQLGKKIGALEGMDRTPNQDVRLENMRARQQRVGGRLGYNAPPPEDPNQTIHRRGNWRG
jgi:hypothetical protein